MAKKVIKMATLLLIALTTVMSSAVLAQSEWWEPAYLNMQKLGYITGDENGNFNPDNYITRAELAVIIGRITNVHHTGMEFSDVTEDSWYRSAIINVTGSGYFSGYEDGTFRAEAYITRAEVAVLLNNVIKNVHPYDTDLSDKVYDGNLVVVWDNLTLKNVTVNGTLYITGAVDEDEIVLERVNADEIVINGTNSVVKLLNTKTDRVLVAGRGITQLILSGNTTISEVVCKNNVKVMKHGFNGEIKSIKPIG